MTYALLTSESAEVVRLDLIVSRPWRWESESAGPEHSCMQCSRSIRWQLCFCCDCSWQGQPIANLPWPSKPREVLA